ncbi:hypothetical protein AVEN_56787-1 [Araneus ventricosus]|uniref:Uncharacterized protein n=1 Tax=Araneus ventricosus TaxID=182803 RepID=A0A4Y2H929_ARAVE|nr:hypothetical protein AVEN_56787-1 [Araneus ventricosus]
MAVTQDSDVEFRSLLGSGSGLELKQLNLPSSQRLLYCDISTGKVRPYVPETFRRKVFEMLHVLLGMRACLKEDIGASPAEMVYGQCLHLPGEFFRNTTSSRQLLSEDTFLQRLRLYTRRLRPVPTSHHSSSTFFVHPDLHTSSHVFVRCDTVRKPLEQPYQGPFKVINRNDKFFKISINKR